MKISNIYIGGWFQRTTLQLSEVYDFLRDGTSQLKLNKDKLQEYHHALAVTEIEYGLAGEEFVTFTTEEGIGVKLYEDGLITLRSDDISEEAMTNEIQRLKDYYETRLSPAVNYLFSLGAPVSAELAHVENIYPYFIVCDNAPKDKLNELLAATDRQKYYEFTNKNYSILRGDEYYFINNKKASPEVITRYIEEQIFIREFKAQLHRYLNLHRVIWENLNLIKTRLENRPKDYDELTDKFVGYQKSTAIIVARLQQMATYLPMRASIAREDQDLADFLAISGYRYDALDSTLAYVQSLWTMTSDRLRILHQLFSDAKFSRLLCALRPLIVLVVLAVILLIATFFK